MSLLYAIGPKFNISTQQHRGKKCNISILGWTYDGLVTFSIAHEGGGAHRYIRKIEDSY